MYYRLHTDQAVNGEGKFNRQQKAIERLIPQILPLREQITSASLVWCHKSTECAKSCVRRSKCFCTQSGGGASIRLITSFVLLSRLTTGLQPLPKRVLYKVWSNDSSFHFKYSLHSLFSLRSYSSCLLLLNFFPPLLSFPLRILQ